MKPTELQSLAFSRLVTEGHNVDIEDLTNDSRQVKPGWLYAALPGSRYDGHSFIPSALDSGACAILCSDIPTEIPPELAVFQSNEPRLALSELADRVHQSPSDHVRVIGVTGTDGKTSTVYFIYQLLSLMGRKAGFISSASFDDGSGERSNPHHQSTPEAPQVHRLLGQMKENGVEFAVVESTSHGLSMKTARLAHVRYEVGVLTNMSHEHLEFHGTFERYRHDKANLFRALEHGRYANAGTAAISDQDEIEPLPRPKRGPIAFPLGQPFGVLNADDDVAPYFFSSTGADVVRYSVTDKAEFVAGSVALRPDGSSFELSMPSGSALCELHVPGLFSVYNAVAAAVTVSALLGTPADVLSVSVSQLRSVRGRMQVVTSTPFSVIVDFAHTPGAFQAILPFFKQQTAGRLIVVFGSAGERDVAKRSVQGRIASEFADVIVLADEDPRGEDRLSILEQIASGCTRLDRGRSLHLIPDRRMAIRHAIELCNEGDTLLLLGKGHETSIIGPRAAEPWDEIRVAQEELSRAGYGAH